MLYIHRIRVKNLRCFSDIDLDLNTDGDPVPWGLFVGDNGTGKTALLRTVALGVCDESSAAGLMKEAAAGYIRSGEKEASITIDLRARNGRRNYRILTKIEKLQSRSGSFERLRQKTDPPSKFPWSKIFVSGYGAGRGTAGTGDVAGYSAIDAVYNLFNYGEGLQNPELTIRRISKPELRGGILQSLGEFLNTGRISLTQQGVKVDGIWGKGMPLRDLADGYKSTFLWVADYLGWALSYNPSWEGAAAIEGILLVDELEQHLHATWQRSLVYRLKQLFPRVQVLTTTHSPLIASSVGSLDATEEGAGDRLFLLEGNPVIAIALPYMRGDRVDQVLASRAFKYLVQADPEVESILQRASVLADKESRRNMTEEAEYEKLLRQIQSVNFDCSTTAPERRMEHEQFREITQMINRLKHAKGIARDDSD